MKATTFVKFAVALAFIAALFYWREVWGWVDAKTWDELAADLIGFALKWCFLALFAFLAATIPHYAEPWLKLARLNGRRRLKAARRGRGASPQSTQRAPNVNKDALLMAFIEREMNGKRRGAR